MGRVVACFKKGEKLRVARDNDNDGYNSFRNEVLKVVSVATSTKEHPGFDEGVGQALYDVETVGGKQVNVSLYEYELEKA